MNNELQDLGKTGQVTKIYSDGDLRVHVEDQVWTLNPLCVKAEHCPDVVESENESSDELKSKFTKHLV